MIRADYPLLLEPHLAERVWGGTSLGRGIGEAWDLSVHPHGPSLIRNGALKGRALADVVTAVPADFGGPIRLLAKRLDCAADLSVQVHPVEHDSKTEAWVVLRGEKNAGVYHGFREPQTTAQIRAAAEDGTLPELLRFLPVNPGQAVFVPSGTVHAIGKGLVLFEIQQSADVTYRLYDWGRGRPLQIDEALPNCRLNGSDALPAPRPLEQGGLRLVSCEHFHVDRIDAAESFRVEPGAAWRAVLLVAGSASFGNIQVDPGDTLLLPKAAGAITLHARRTCTALTYGPGAG